MSTNKIFIGLGIASGSTGFIEDSVGHYTVILYEEILKMELPKIDSDDYKVTYSASDEDMLLLAMAVPYFPGIMRYLNQAYPNS